MGSTKDKLKKRYFISEAASYLLRYNRPYAKSIPINKKQAKMIAHRGLSGVESENTLQAFEAAGRLSYYGIETDVHRSADGAYLIIHDDDTKRVSGIGNIVEKTESSVLRKLKLKDPKGRIKEGYYIPTLEEYVNICKKHGKVCVLELKNHFEEEDVLNIAKAIDAEKYIDKTVFISFDLPNLISLRKHYPKAEAQYLIYTFCGEIIELLKQHKLDLDIYYRELSKARIEMLHQSRSTAGRLTAKKLPKGLQTGEQII